MQPPNPRSTPPRNTDWTAPPPEQAPGAPHPPPLPPPENSYPGGPRSTPSSGSAETGSLETGFRFLLFFVFFVYHRAAHGTTPRNTPQVGGCTGDPARPPKLQKTPPTIQKSTKKDTKQYGKPNQNNINTEEKL